MEQRNCLGANYLNAKDFKNPKQYGCETAVDLLRFRVNNNARPLEILDLSAFSISSNDLNTLLDESIDLSSVKNLVLDNAGLTPAVMIKLINKCPNLVFLHISAADDVVRVLTQSSLHSLKILKLGDEVKKKDLEKLLSLSFLNKLLTLDLKNCTSILPAEIGNLREKLPDVNRIELQPGHRGNAWEEDLRRNMRCRERAGFDSW
jgi:hypothetical protein